MERRSRAYLPFWSRNTSASWRREELGNNIPINCFLKDPSIKSSLTFLRKTKWAREKVEDLYLYTVKRKDMRGEREN